MPRLSTPETATADDALDLHTAAADAAGDDAAVAGASAVVEAATAEAAIAEVHERFGPGATIVEARRVLRGGIGGFFAKEHVQLHVAAEPSPVPASRTAPAARMAPAEGDDIAARAVALAAELTQGSPGDPGGGPGEDPGPASPVDRLLRSGDAEERTAAEDAGLTDEAVDFGTFLRTQLARQGGGGAAPAAPADPAEVAPVPADQDTPAAAVQPATHHRQRDVQRVRWPGSHDPWSVYGVDTRPAPAAPPAAPPVAAPTDGPGWSTTRLLHLGLPAGLVHHLDVAEPTDDLSWLGALTDALRSLCRPLPTGPAVLVGPDAPALGAVVDLPVARSRTWLDALGANRWRHLVIGGQGWRSELTDEPLAVSWVRTDDLPDALRCATELGLVLGYGPQGGQLRRARALDVALAVRELVESP